MKTASLVLLLLVTHYFVIAQSEPKLVPVAEGWARNSVNSIILRHNALVTYKNTQFIAFYNAEQQVVLAKRTLGTTKWTIKITQYKGDATDAHRSISIMVDGDGYLHVSWDHHNNELRYCRSASPGSLEMTGKMQMTGIKENRVSYPEFYRLQNGNLLFFYRDGTSGNGDLMLNHYDVKAKKWSQVQDGWINGEGQRNAYWQVATDTKGTLHVSWVWRETGDVATNHDICYAKSDDEGKTWQKSTGEKYVLPITAATAEYACRIPQKSELINTTATATDATGRPYITTYWRDANSKIPQYWLVYNNGTKWITSQISSRRTPFTLSGTGTRRFPISRPQVMVSSQKGKIKLLMVYRDNEEGDRVSVAVTQDLLSGSWQVKNLTNLSVGLWEPSYDTELWKREFRLHLFVQKVEQGDGEKLTDLPPQPVSVLEWNPGWK